MEIYTDVRGSERSAKALTPEPEIEENCEDNRMKELLRSLGLDFEKISKVKIVTHAMSDDSCVHCQLEEKIELLKTGIKKLENEIESTEEILKSKRSQNNDVRVVIERLEGIMSRNNSSDGREDRTCKDCKCYSCLII